MPAPSERRVKEIIAEVCRAAEAERSPAWEEIGSDQPLFSVEGGEESLGLDSLDAVEIATALEEEFDLVLPTELDPLELRTVREVMALLERLRAEQHGPAKGPEA